MADPTVGRWKPRGLVFLWQYTERTKDYPGWHLTADGDGCASLIELLDLCLEARWPCDATVTVAPPTATILSVAGNRGGAARVEAAGGLRIRYAKGKVDDAHWALRYEAGVVRLDLGPARLGEVRAGLLAISQGEGDFSLPLDLAGDDGRLWLW